MYASVHALSIKDDLFRNEKDSICCSMILYRMIRVGEKHGLYHFLYENPTILVRLICENIFQFQIAFQIVNRDWYRYMKCLWLQDDHPSNGKLRFIWFEQKIYLASLKNPKFSFFFFFFLLVSVISFWFDRQKFSQTWWRRMHWIGFLVKLEVNKICITG